MISYETFQAADVRQALSALGDLIAEFPDLQTNSKFIFVPGPSDPGPSNIFPRYLRMKSTETDASSFEYVNNLVNILVMGFGCNLLVTRLQ